MAILWDAPVESVRQPKIDNSQLPQFRHDNVSRFEILLADIVTMNVGDVGPKGRPGIIQWDTGIIVTRCAPLIRGQLVVGLQGFTTVLQQEHVGEIRYSE